VAPTACDPGYVTASVPILIAVGSLPAATGRKMHFTGTTVLRIQNGKIAQEIGLDDGVKALTQLGLIKAGLNRR
jgi:hypothetical protein